MTVHDKIAEFELIAKKHGIKRSAKQTLKTLKEFNNTSEACIWLDIYKQLYDISIPGDSKQCLISLSVYWKFNAIGVTSVKTKNAFLRFQYDGYWYTFLLNQKWFAMVDLFDQHVPWPYKENKFRIKLPLLNKTAVKVSNVKRKKRKDAGKTRGPSYGKTHAGRRVRGIMKSDPSYLRNVIKHENRKRVNNR